MNEITKRVIAKLVAKEPKHYAFKPRRGDSSLICSPKGLCASLEHCYGEAGWRRNLVDDLDTLEEIREANSWVITVEKAGDASDYEDDELATITFETLPWVEVDPLMRELGFIVQDDEPHESADEEEEEEEEEETPAAPCPHCVSVAGSTATLDKSEVVSLSKALPAGEYLIFYGHPLMGWGYYVRCMSETLQSTLGAILDCRGLDIGDFWEAVRAQLDATHNASYRDEHIGFHITERVQS